MNIHYRSRNLGEPKTSRGSAEVQDPTNSHSCTHSLCIDEVGDTGSRKTYTQTKRAYHITPSNIYSTNFTTTCSYTLHPVVMDLSLLTKLRILHYRNIKEAWIFLEKWKHGYMHILLTGIQAGITQTLLKFIA
jgi:hypothetical protein